MHNCRAPAEASAGDAGRSPRQGPKDVLTERRNVMSQVSCRKWIVLVIAAAWLAGCNSSAQTPALHEDPPFIHEEGCVRVPDASSLRKSLRIAMVEEQSVEAPIVVPAVVEADPAKLIREAPPVSGRIVQLYRASRRCGQKRRRLIHPRFRRCGPSVQRCGQSPGGPQSRQA